VTIEVKAPKRLGNSRDGYMGVDEEDQRENVDSLITVWSGRYGVPPQLLKAQIDTEANYESQKEAYTPSYLYEPYVAQYFPAIADGSFGGPFWLDTPGAPTGALDHENVETYDYPDETTTVWDIIMEYSDLECVTEATADCDRSPDPYGRLRTNRTRTYSVWDRENQESYTYEVQIGEFYFSKYSVGIEYYDELIRLKDRAKKDSTYSLTEARKDARNYFNDYLKNDWRGGDVEGTVAQTRIAASYGYGQVLYTTAVLDPPRGVSYPKREDRPPEKMNEPTMAMQIYLGMYMSLLEGELGSDPRAVESNWSLGYENTLRRVLDAWNTHTDYTPVVLNAVDRFLPLK